MADDFNLKLELAKRMLAKDMPDEYKRAKIGEMGILDSMKYPNAGASTDESNNIKVNRLAMSSLSQDDMNDTLLHELVHVRQNNMNPIRRFIEVYREQGMFPYGQRPRELEAYQAEKDKAMKEGRVPIYQPSFTGAPINPRDIVLPKDKK